MPPLEKGRAVTLMTGRVTRIWARLLGPVGGSRLAWGTQPEQTPISKGAGADWAPSWLHGNEWGTIWQAGGA